MGFRTFFCYSHEDKKWLSRLKTHLKPYQVKGMIDIWDDTVIRPGDKWLHEIRDALHQAEAAVFLVTGNFLASDFIQREEVPTLLRRAEDEGVQILWIAVEPHAPDHLLTPFQAVNDPQRPLSSFQGNTRTQQLVDIAFNIATAIEPSDPPTYPRADHIQNIHILTSVKGGVGKTLLSLSLIGSYAYRNLSTHNGKVLAVDANSVNMDLFRILAHKGNSRSLPNGLHWRCSEVEMAGRVRGAVVRRDQPYVLPMGIAEFWREIEQLSPSFPDHDIVIDTNMHVANLIDGPPLYVDTRPPTRIGPIEVLNHLLDDHHRLYVWIVWTFAALRDPERYVAEGIARFDALSKQARRRVNFVHVLNPSVLVPPQSPLEEQLQSFYEIGAMRTKINELMHELPAGDPGIGLLAEMRERLTIERMNRLNFVADDTTGRMIGVFPGLQNLMENEEATDEIGDKELLHKIQASIIEAATKAKLRDVFEAIYTNEFESKGRPRNLLPIYIHDTELQGYTERPDLFAISDVTILRDHLGQAQDIMDEFLIGLMGN